MKPTPIRTFLLATIHALCLSLPLLTHGGENSPAKQPVVPAPLAVPEDEWKFRIEGYGWLSGLEGTVGALGLTSNVDVSFSDILETMEMAAALQFEARKGRWGLLLDGLYMRLSTGGSTPGPFYSSAEIGLEQLTVEAAIAYRLWEGEKGYVDVFAGARYNGMEIDIQAIIDREGVRQVSEAASERVVDEVVARATAIVKEQAMIAANRLQDQVSAKIYERLAAAWVQLPDGLRDFLQRPAVKEALKGLAQEQAALAREIAQEKLAPLKSALQQKLQKRVERAKRNLAKALNRELLDRLPENVSGSKEWVDPIVGIRAQWNLTRRLFLNVKGDVGGFGVASDFAWTAQGTVGFNFTDSVFVELGYKHAGIDYTSGDFVYDVDLSGAFVGMGLRF